MDALAARAHFEGGGPRPLTTTLLLTDPLDHLLYYTSYLLQLTAKVVDLASWAMLHLWAGAERTREFVAPLLHMKATAA